MLGVAAMGLSMVLVMNMIRRKPEECNELPLSATDRCIASEFIVAGLEPYEVRFAQDEFKKFDMDESGKF